MSGNAKLYYGMSDSLSLDQYEYRSRSPLPLLLHQAVAVQESDPKAKETKRQNILLVTIRLDPNSRLTYAAT